MLLHTGAGSVHVAVVAVLILLYSILTTKRSNAKMTLLLHIKGRDKSHGPETD